MNNQGDRDIHDLVTKSLREHLVPAHEWFRRFYEVECSGIFTMYIPGMDAKETEPYWMVPYPYSVPAYYPVLAARYPDRAYLAEADLQNIPLEVYNEMVTTVQDRMSTFIANMLHDDTVSFLDGNADFGVVIHSTTGRVRAFNYSEIRSFEFVNIPIACEYRMARAMKDHIPLEKPMMQEYFDLLHENRFKCNVWVRPIFIEEKGDSFNGATNHATDWSITEATPIDPADAVSIIHYVRECTAIHKKVLLLP